MNELHFVRVEGAAVPLRPWPQKFIVTRTLILSDAVEVRPLTVTGFVKGVGQNLVTMMFWRLCWTLRAFGFLSTPEACRYRWRDLTWRFWRYQDIDRVRWVRRVRRFGFRVWFRLGSRWRGFP